MVPNVDVDERDWHNPLYDGSVRIQDITAVWTMAGACACGGDWFDVAYLYL